MLDLNWERSIPIANMNVNELKNIFTEYDNAITITNFSAIQIGCRNSNFIVSTNKGKFIVRTTNINELNNENIAYELVKSKINVPNLLFHTTKYNLNIFIYQYIKSVSLQKIIIDNEQCDLSFIEQVARTAAIIHNIPKEKTTGLVEFDIPPFEMWYQIFLDNKKVKERLGSEMHEKTLRLVLDKQSFMSEIDKYNSFIHCDFRPANMIVDEHKQVFFVDWEMASTGHSLGDIGQFFRYRSFFNYSHVNLFEQVYNTYANRKLADNWFDLSLFRDLVNPLQMLSSNQEAPFRNADLVNIIKETLAYFGY